MKERTYFLIYTSNLEAMESLTDRECGRLFRAMLKYAADGTVPEKMGNEKFLFPQMKYQIDRDREKYTEMCEKARKNAEKRWNNAAACDGIKGNANKNNNKNKNKNKINSKSKSENAQPPAPSPAPTPTLEEVEDYCRRRSLNVNPKRFYDYYSERGWVTSDGKAVDDWYCLLDNWHKTENTPRGKTGESCGSFNTDDFFAAAVENSYSAELLAGGASPLPVTIHQPLLPHSGTPVNIS